MPIKRGLFHVYSNTIPSVLNKVLGLAGFNVSRRSDFYSPLPTVSLLKRNFDRWNRPSALIGVDYDFDLMKMLLASLLEKYLAEFLELPPYEELHRKGFGLGYTPVDALTLYLMIRHLKPRLYMEVGSGLSTYYCSLAAERNAAEGSPVEIVCIEPYPSPQLRSLQGIDLYEKEVQDVEPEFFARLDSGDVLFIDSSHTVRIDGDVPYLYLEVLPALPGGVNIHIHDVPFPYNVPYPADLWVFNRAEPMFWTEAMLVQALLSGSGKFRIELSIPLLRFHDEEFLSSHVPIYRTVADEKNACSSLWIRSVT